jgi:hypothetical protein
VQQGLVQVLLLAEVLFGALSLGGVAGYRRVADDVAGGVPDLGDGERTSISLPFLSICTVS